MSDTREGKLRSQSERGRRAKALLENELLLDAFDSIEKALLQAWRESNASEIDGREDVWRSTQLLNNLRKALEQHVISGKTAGKELLQIQDKSKLRKVLNV